MDIQQLINNVQLNCHISDARHAGNYTLCVYLLKMREFYRWEHQHAFSEKLSSDDIGNWLSRREALWDKIENEDYRLLHISSSEHDPFDSHSINQKLSEQNLVYSGGYGVKDKAHFFLAELEKKESINNYSIYISGKEYARDLTSPPAMSHNKTIFIRRESFKRLIWERTDEWRWNKPENAMARAIRCYDFDNDLEIALTEMTDNELDAAVLHEIGEIQAGEKLVGWHQMMADISFTQAEIMARAVRDHYADTLHTLPTLIENNNRASIHFYFANLTNMRKHIFPALMNAYNKWCETRNINTIEQTVATSLDHWKNIAEQMLALHQQDAERCSVRIETLVKNSHI
ncbi:MAG: Sfum_1244 family protein [Gammaproteobacteria bacterium]